METTIKIAIYIHAFFGGIGLLAGFGSVIFKKGSRNHKQSGKLFSIGMIISSLISLPICWLPKHENIFLFLIGIFTIYLVLSGNRVLGFRRKSKADFTDKLISATLLVSAVLMLAFGILDFKFYKTMDQSKISQVHIGKMTGAFTASITAFLVAGIQLNGLIYWILPSLLAGIFISYWTRKVQKPKAKKVTL